LWGLGSRAIYFHETLLMIQMAGPFPYHRSHEHQHAAPI
jgi:hypothetical protein